MQCQATVYTAVNSFGDVGMKHPTGCRFYSYSRAFLYITCSHTRSRFFFCVFLACDPSSSTYACSPSFFIATGGGCVEFGHDVWMGVLLSVLLLAFAHSAGSYASEDPYSYAKYNI